MAVRSHKQTDRDLAVLGGTAAFDEPVHVGRPNIGDIDTFLSYARDILDRRWLSNNGTYVQELEKRLCEWLGVRHCIPVCNGTVALEVAIRAAGLSGEVIVPSFTFVATAYALQWLGIDPVFCDIDPVTHLLDPALVERLITPRTTGILPVHLWGTPCAPHEFESLANTYNLKLLFDAAHALGCSHHGKMVGNFGLGEIFSFHATKFFNTFEGGAIATNDDEFAERVRLLINFGFAGYDNSIHVGTNGKMNEISAAMGLTGLKSIDAFVAANRSHFEEYRRRLADTPGVRLRNFASGERHNYQHIVLRIDREHCPLTRDELIDLLWAENVMARRYFYPGCHRMPAMRGTNYDLPMTEQVSGEVLVLPTGTAIDHDDIVEICAIINIAIGSAESVRASLKATKGSSR